MAKTVLSRILGVAMLTLLVFALCITATAKTSELTLENGVISGLF